MNQIVEELRARGVTEQDLRDVVYALLLDRLTDLTMLPLSAEDTLTKLAQAAAEETEKLTEQGLAAQVQWMSAYYGNNDHLYWALSGFLRLPELQAVA